jgi:hypothetical protein
MIIFSKGRMNSLFYSNLVGNMGYILHGCSFTGVNRLIRNRMWNYIGPRGSIAWCYCSVFLVNVIINGVCRRVITRTIRARFYEFLLSLCKIVRSSVILLLPLLKRSTLAIWTYFLIYSMLDIGNFSLENCSEFGNFVITLIRHY